MRIATFNVENLFDRAKVFNDPNPNAHRDVLDAHAALNKLFEKARYSDADKERMLALIKKLGMLKRDEGPYTWLRKIRGTLISRPRSGPDPYIKANGRDDWVGWCELKTGPVNEIAIENTARVIRDVNADILALVEVESRPVLKAFQDAMLKKLGLSEGYRHLMVIDGNDSRGIDVGLATKSDYPIGPVRSHVNARTPEGALIFSRDCPEYAVDVSKRRDIIVLLNHFKSKFGGNNAASKRKRRNQAKAIVDYYTEILCEGNDDVVVLGDLNDTPESDELAPLLKGTDLRDVSEHPSFTDFEFRANNGHRGIGTYGRGNDRDKIDYILLSPALFERVTAGGIFRKGAWPGSRPKRWDVYPELKEPHHAASDHHALWVDIDF